MEYTKAWLPLEKQVERLVARGLEIDDEGRAVDLLRSVGYYRLTGYLYPFLRSEERVEDGRTRRRVLSSYLPGTALHHAECIIDFDRRLRMLVMEGAERLEVALRMRTGYVLGEASAFAHEDPACFTEAFTAPRTDSRDPRASPHVLWLQRVKEVRDKSDELFVEHFREKYDGRMPIWALTELLEMGQLSRVYRGMLQPDAEKIASAFGAPTKKIMTSWLASLNYVRNVAAHHARLFNRKLQNAPSRPAVGKVPLLDHLSAPDSPKRDFGTYNALAVIAYLLMHVDTDSSWAHSLVELLHDFPTSHALSVRSIGAPDGWEGLPLWQM
ncbi:abortive phage infection protein [Brachybacterium avium]|uniref:Abortive phage infection protein n=1 Tax=Brachybacterium avium TaxID=2017485 RepID=A0A220UGN4_9MICO|nr:abortive phage infection protein [Brachybacterium avium]